MAIKSAVSRVAKYVHIPPHQQQLLVLMKENYGASHSYLIRLGIELAVKHVIALHQGKNPEQGAAQNGND